MRNNQEAMDTELFWEDLYQNQGKMQPFGYTGYQRDSVSGTYYAQKKGIPGREWQVCRTGFDRWFYSSIQKHLTDIIIVGIIL